MEPDFASDERQGGVAPDGQARALRVWRVVAKRALMAGIDWHYAQDKAHARQVVRTLKKSVRGASVLAAPNADGSWVVGAFGARLPRIKGRPVAGALVLAQIVENGIVALNLEGGVCWLAAIANHCVLPQHDVVVERAALEGVINRWMREMDRVDFFGDLPGSLMTGDELAQTLQDRVQAGDIDAAALKAATLPQNDAVLRVVLYAAAASVLAGMGWTVWQQTQKHPEAPTINLALVESARKQQEDAARQARLRQRFEQAVQEQRDALQSSAGQWRAAASAQAVLDALRDMRAPYAFARLQQVSCEPSPATPSEAAAALRWQCAPLWGVPQGSLMAQAALSGAQQYERLLQTSGSPGGVPGALGSVGSLVMVPGAAFELRAQPALARQLPTPSSWVNDRALWALSLRDGLSAMRFARLSYNWSGLKALEVRPEGFQEDGVALQNTPAQALGYEQALSATMPIALWPVFRAWIERHPSLLTKIRLDGQLLSVDVRFFYW